MKNFTTIFTKVLFPVFKKIFENLFKYSGLVLFLLIWYIFTFHNEQFNEIPTNEIVFGCMLIIMSQIIND